MEEIPPESAYLGPKLWEKPISLQENIQIKIIVSKMKIRFLEVHSLLHCSFIVTNIHAGRQTILAREADITFMYLS